MNSLKENFGLCLCELEDRNSSLLNLVTQYKTDYKFFNGDANQREVNLTSELESKN